MINLTFSVTFCVNIGVSVELTPMICIDFKQCVELTPLLKNVNKKVSAQLSLRQPCVGVTSAG